MLENLSIKEMIVYLFKAKRWTGGESIFRVWTDVLSEFSEMIVQHVIKKALDYDGHIDATSVFKWAKRQQELTKAHAPVKMTPVYKFCYWCIKETTWDTSCEDHYCMVCLAKWNEEKSIKAKELFEQGKLEYKKRCRDYILANQFDFEKKDKYLKKMLEIKGKDGN